jgi:hypothetical protein
MMRCLPLSEANQEEQVFRMDVMQTSWDFRSGDRGMVSGTVSARPLPDKNCDRVGILTEQREFPTRSRVLVRNLSPSTTSEALRAFFAGLGYGYGIQDIECGPNEQWCLPQGYAVVTLSHNVDPATFIEQTDGKDFQGRALIVDGIRPLRWRYRSERAA